MPTKEPEYWDLKSVRKYCMLGSNTGDELRSGLTNTTSVRTPKVVDLQDLVNIVRSLLRLGHLASRLTGEPRLLDQTNPSLQPTFAPDHKTWEAAVVILSKTKQSLVAYMIQCAGGRLVHTIPCRDCQGPGGLFASCVTLADNGYHFAAGACADCVFKGLAHKCTKASMFMICLSPNHGSWLTVSTVALEAKAKAVLVEDSESDDSVIEMPMDSPRATD